MTLSQEEKPEFICPRCGHRALRYYPFGVMCVICSYVHYWRENAK